MRFGISNTKKLTAAVLAIAAFAACGGAPDTQSEEGIGTVSADDVIAQVESDTVAPAAVTTGTSAERRVAARLGLPGRFAIGLGNDAESYDPNGATAFRLGPKMDIHYMYLSGLPGEGGWTDWNPDGSYVTMYANAAKARGVVPMFTLYQAAAWGEGNLYSFTNRDFMTKYWRGVRTMYQRLGKFASPAIVHLEPDLWGYFQQQRGDDPAKAPVLTGSIASECAGLPENAAGFGRCAVKMARLYAPNVMVGLSASAFGAFTNGVSDPARIGGYLAKVGGAEADITVVETLDRDAGCFERATDPLCKRAGSFYWDESNVRHPNFHDHLTWAKKIRAAVGKPLLWWQMPLGVPSGTSGSTNAYRDNRVRYVFSHAYEFAQAGGIGAVFGTGAPNQTSARTDGGQFKNAATRYLSTGGNALN